MMRSLAAAVAAAIGLEAITEAERFMVVVTAVPVEDTELQDAAMAAR